MHWAENEPRDGCKTVAEMQTHLAEALLAGVGEVHELECIRQVLVLNTLNNEYLCGYYEAEDNEDRVELVVWTPDGALVV